MIKIVITGEKGGTGKSTITALLIDYLNHLGKKTNLLDTDPLQISQAWKNNCQEEGRIVSASVGYEYQVIDTAGTSGSSLAYIQSADLILVPFIPHYADILVITPWFTTLKKEIQQKVYFLPNRYQKTKEQQEGLKQIHETIIEESAGHLLPHLSHRPALYGVVLNGNKENFFDLHSKNEVKSIFQQLLKSLENKIKLNHA
jgi:cellulose biosynthesis protein BcsQ